MDMLKFLKFYDYTNLSKHVKLYTLNIYSFLYVSQNSVKKSKKKRENGQKIEMHFQVAEMQNINKYLNKF